MAAISTPAVAYPADVTFATGSLERNRVTVFFRSILAIPAFIVLYIYTIGLMITTLIAWFVVLFTGKYPPGLYSFAVNTMRLTTNVYAYLFFITDEYPPWSGSDPKAQSYPSQFSVAYSGESNRVTVLFRSILAIPALIFAGVVFAVAEILGVIAWFAIVFTGRYPEGMLTFVEGALRSLMRVNSYYYFLTDVYPPFSMS